MSDVFERTGEAFELGDRLTVLGRKLRPGDPAPPFTLDCLDAPDGAIVPVSLGDSRGAVRLLNVMNSIDTPVCQVGSRQWELRLPHLPSGTRIFTISMDLPFALARWRVAEGSRASSSRRAGTSGSAAITACWSRSGACSSGLSS